MLDPFTFFLLKGKLASLSLSLSLSLLSLSHFKALPYMVYEDFSPLTAIIRSLTTPLSTLEQSILIVFMILRQLIIENTISWTNKIRK
jgi:uncharacterized protein YggT (Ycf19 family)